MDKIYFLKQLLMPVLLLTVLLGYWHLGRLQGDLPAATDTGQPATATAILPEDIDPAGKILLLPLDGRPPCRQMVISAGRITGTEIRVPPQEVLDYYSQPGDTAGTRAWLRENIAGAKAAIISIDQLLYGGLLAAREKTASQEDTAALLAFLRELHTANPEVPLYVFSILPRLMPQDTIDGYQERKDLIAYSRLVGRQAAGQEADEQEIARLRDRIPPESLRKYLHRFQENERLNQQLIDLAGEGTIKRLVLGQDDGEAYSIPNIEKSALTGYIAAQGLTGQQVFLTHGADEIALTFLAEIEMQRTGKHPRVYIDASSHWAREHYLPYMAISSGACAREKLELLGITPAETPEEADCVLYLSVNDHEADTLGSRADSVRRLQAYHSQGKPVALVDLSQHFRAEEALLPQLIAADFPLNSLAAYAGWNTASNSIGTALAEAVLCLSAQDTCRSKDSLSALAQARTDFLQGRLLEDYYYLKAEIDIVNRALHKAGYHNTADLDLEHNYRYANAMLQKGLARHAAMLASTRAARAPFTLSCSAGSVTLQQRRLHFDASFPWPRTFEIYLQAQPELVPLKQNP